MRGCKDKFYLSREGLRESLFPQVFQEKWDSSNLTLSTDVVDTHLWLCGHPLELQEENRHFNDVALCPCF